MGAVAAPRRGAGNRRSAKAGGDRRSNVVFVLVVVLLVLALFVVMLAAAEAGLRELFRRYADVRATVYGPTSSLRAWASFRSARPTICCCKRARA